MYESRQVFGTRESAWIHVCMRRLISAHTHAHTHSHHTHAYTHTQAHAHMHAHHTHAYTNTHRTPLLTNVTKPNLRDSPVGAFITVASLTCPNCICIYGSGVRVSGSGFRMYLRGRHCDVQRFGVRFKGFRVNDQEFGVQQRPPL
jgi:hypothetical protein